MVFTIELALVALMVVRSSSAEAPRPPPHLTAVQVQVHFSQNGERKPVPYELVRGVLLFKARVAGREVWALLDNGMGASLIDAEFARSLGLKVGPKAGELRTPTDPLELRNAADVAIEIPGQIDFTTPLYTVDLSHVSKSEGTPVSLVLGADYFDYFLFWIDQDNGTFQIGPSRAMDMPADLRLRVPPDAPYLVLNNARAQTSITINGQIAVVTVDLGYNGALALNEAAWSRLGLNDLPTTDGSSVHADGRTVSTRSAIAEKVSFGPVMAHGVTVDKGGVLDDGGDGIVGMGFFRWFNFAVDIRDRRIWLISKAGSGDLPKLEPSHATSGH